eukprot:scaffold52613_cov55-Phaeocystis_antarctica.AAC.3
MRVDAVGLRRLAPTLAWNRCPVQLCALSVSQEHTLRRVCVWGYVRDMCYGCCDSLTTLGSGDNSVRARVTVRVPLYGQGRWPVG